MTRRTLYMPPFGAYCVDDVRANIDGSIQVVGATQGACGNTPPPPVDPNAMTQAIILWKSDHGGQRSIDPRELVEIFGRQGPNDSPHAWPYIASTVEIPIPAGKHLRSRIHATALGMHYPRLVFNGYLTHPDPGRLWRLTVALAGNDQPIVPAAEIRNHLDNDTTAFAFSTDGSHNTLRVPLVPGQDYDLIVQPEDGLAGTISLTWYS